MCDELNQYCGNRSKTKRIYQMQKKHQVNGTKGPVIVCAGIYGRYRLHFFCCCWTSARYTNFQWHIWCCRCNLIHWCPVLIFMYGEYYWIPRSICTRTFAYGWPENKKKSTQSLLTYIRRQNPYAIYVPTGTPNMNPKPRHLLLDFQIISGIADTRHGI